MMLADQPLWVQRLDELHLLTALQVVALLVGALIVSLLVRLIINRLTRRVLTFPGADRHRAEARQRALATALRSAIIGVIWATAAILVLGEVGVNVGAFVATATIIGGAIAFGAQTMVRDMIAGLFVLAEDQYGVGDEVDLGTVTGRVERISLRSVRVSDRTGVVWHVPHGGVTRVGNLSKSSLAHFDLEVDRATPLQQLEAAAAALCSSLAEHPQAQQWLVGPPTADGLIALRDDRLVYRVSAPVQPGSADRVSAVWRQLVLAAFEVGELVAPHGRRSAPAETAPADPVVPD